MKTKILLMSGLIAAASTLSSCGDSFLEVNSPTQQFLDSYFTADSTVNQSIVAAYDPLQWPDWGLGEYNPPTLLADLMGDDMWVGGSNATDNENWHLMANYAATPQKVIKGLWTTAYSGIKRCNDVLTYIEWTENANNLNLQKKPYYLAQTYVLRAYYSTWLWKFWGAVPYFRTNLTSPYTAPKISADELYNYIMEDLESAIATNALPMKAASGEEGRVTRAMAYMLYTEVVMYQKDEARYPQALSYMKEIINSGDYALNPDYANIFTEAGEWTSESIWEINYIDDNAVRDWGAPLNAGGTVLPTLISPADWPAGQDGHSGGWGFGPVRQSTVDMFANNDARKKATCWDAAGFAQANGIQYTARYQDTGFFLEKYSFHSGDNADQKASSELNHNENLRIYRYSETLLNAAELLLRTNGSVDEAKRYLNQVRSRAGIGEVEATIDNVLNERHLEFVGEGKRYWDLIRTGKAANTLTPDEFGYRTNSWTEARKYLPIPQSELDADPNLTQNENYK